MRCELIHLPGGQAAIVCGRGPLRQARCHVCGAPAAYQCDAPAPTPEPTLADVLREVLAICDRLARR